MKTLSLVLTTMALATAALAQTNTISDSGSVGIGTTNPESTLQVRGTFFVNAVADQVGGLYYGGANNGLVVGNYGASPWPGTNGLFVGGTSILWGNVGIGTANPRSRLDIGSELGAGRGTRIGDYLELNEREYYNNATSIGWNASIAANDGTYKPAYAGPGGSGMVLAMEGGGIGNLDFWGRNWNESYSPVFLGSFVHVLRLSTNGNVGIGTTAPGYKLDIAVPTVGEPTSLKLSGGATGGIQMRVGDDYAGAIGTRYSGADTFISSNSYQNCINTDSWAKGVSSYGSTVAVLGINPAPNSPAFQVKYSPANTANGGMGSFFTADLLTIFANGNVGIGTTNPTEKLSVKGKIRAQEVIVETTNWSDHVFADSYKLQSLAEVEQHIKTDKHLPGVPSAQEVAEKGVSVGDMQAILLAKVEELTLHVISQQKQLNAQQAQMAAQQAEIAHLKSATP